jgi:hypothetical protein
MIATNTLFLPLPCIHCLPLSLLRRWWFGSNRFSNFGGVFSLAISFWSLVVHLLVTSYHSSSYHCLASLFPTLCCGGLLAIDFQISSCFPSPPTYHPPPQSPPILAPISTPSHPISGLHLCHHGVPDRRGARAGRQRVQGPQGEAHHPPSLAARHPRRRGARHQ